MKITTLSIVKDGVEMKVALHKDDQKHLLQYAINDLMEKGALSIIKDRNEEQVYRLIFEEVKGHA